jgi:hypothetical protein
MYMYTYIYVSKHICIHTYMYTHMYMSCMLITMTLNPMVIERISIITINMIRAISRWNGVSFLTENHENNSITVNSLQCYCLCNFQ